MTLTLKVQQHVRLSPKMVKQIYDDVLTVDFHEWREHFEDNKKTVDDFSLKADNSIIVYRVNLSWRLITIMDVF